MFDDIQKPRKTHQKKTKWGGQDKFSKSQKKAGKRIRADLEDQDWQDDVVDNLRGFDRT